MEERFARPCVAAIIKKTLDGEKYILTQIRMKADGGDSNGLLELPAGKIREYENIFDALRREVYEETGLTLTKIYGEDKALYASSAQAGLLSFEPFCVTQNLSGIYSIVLNTFVCEAKGEVLPRTNETANIRWTKASEVKTLLATQPSLLFPMHIIALKKYLGL